MPKFDSCFSIVRDFLLRHLDNAFVGTEEFAELTLSVHPNPVIDKLHVSGATEEGSFVVIDLSGRCWLAFKATASHELSLDVSGLPKGVYLLLYRKKDGTSAVKFEKY